MAFSNIILDGFFKKGFIASPEKINPTLQTPEYADIRKAGHDGGNFHYPSNLTHCLQFSVKLRVVPW